MKKLIAILILAALVTLPSKPAYASETAENEETGGTAIVLDVLLARPLGIASLAIGTAIFFIALPYTIPSWTIGRSADKLIAEPFKFTFLRPVGNVWEEEEL